MRISDTRGPAQRIYARTRLLDLELGARMQSTRMAPGRTLVVVLAPELHQNQTIYVHVDTGVGLNFRGNSLVGLADNDSTFVVAKQVIVPKGRALPVR